MKALFIKLSLMLLVGSLLLSPSISAAIDITYLDPEYYISDSFTFDFETPAIAFDANHNLYTVDKRDFRTTDPSNTIDILKLDAATDYSTSSVYASITARGISGLAFDQAGNLYVAEFGRVAGFLDVGRIDKIDTSLNVSTIVVLPDFRPTSITLDSAGNIYFPGRLDSDPFFGNIYTIDLAGGPLEVLVENFVGTGIAIDVTGDIFVSTSSVSVPYHDGKTIYRFDPDGLTRVAFARSLQIVEELSFDWEGKHLFVLEVTEFTPDGSNPPEMITISPKVTIDIKPGSYPNSINLRSKGVVPVAILSTDNFDAYDVDPASCEFAGADPLRWSMEDVDYDGDDEMVLHYKTQELVLLNQDSTEADLYCETYDGLDIIGTDSVNIVP